MKRYGKNIPSWREDDLKFAPKSSKWNTETEGGDIKNSLRSSTQKRRIRKTLKAVERQKSKKIINTFLLND